MENNRKLIHLIIFTSLLFLSIILYLTYFQIFQRATVAKNPYNRRQWQREENTLRGNIYDRYGVLLAETQVTEQGMERVYPQKNLYSHLIGYSHRRYGRAGVEAYYNDDLLGLSQENFIFRLWDQLRGKQATGNHLVLTLDHELQKKAYQLLRGKRGAVVAMDPRTGEVLAMVSQPDFDPSQLEAQWEGLVENEASPLLNRATSGLYPPGSIFKPVMAAAALENPKVDTNYLCTGKIVIDGYTLSDYDTKGHGEEDLRKSLVVSCNTNFARIAQELGSKKVMELAERFSFDSSLKADIPVQRNRFPYESLTPTDLAAVSIGQGKLLVTPLQMAAVASAFAQEGLMPQPRVIKSVQQDQGRILREMNIETTRVMAPEIANGVKEMMVAVVKEGTGKKAAISGVTVAGKTGTAQNETGDTHAWFMGFAPAENPRVVVVVLLEREGASGGAAAAPIAREVLKEALKRGES